MSGTTQREPNPFRFLPLLRSIAAEIQDRSAALARIEKALFEITGSPRHREERERQLVAEGSAHRRELRLARREVERLGCTVVGTEPLTLRIPIHTRAPFRSLLWQPCRSAELEPEGERQASSS
jgi:hypothetical protein